MASNGTIGANGGLPWRLPDDLRRFRALTTGHAVIMGRKTWASLPRALPGRQNIVVTRDRSFRRPGRTPCIRSTTRFARSPCRSPVYCIGGAELDRLALPHADVVHLTEIERDFEGDVRLPALDPRAWREIAREPRRLDGPEGFAYAFVTYERIR